MQTTVTWVNQDYAALIDALDQGRPWANVISNSRRNRYAECEQSWAYQDLQGLQPVTDPIPLRLGRIFHAALAMAYQHLADPDHTRGLAAVHQELIRWAFEQVEKSTRPDAWGEIQPLVEQAREMSERTVRRWWQHDRDHLEVVATEIPFRMPLPMPTAHRRSYASASKRSRGYTGLSHWDFVGVIDLIVRVKTGPTAGTFHVIDHKSWGGSDAQRYQHDLLWEQARVGYAWAVQRALDTVTAKAGDQLPLCPSGMGHVASSMIYNVCRKKPPAEPALNQHRSCKGAGCPSCNNTGKGAISKKVSDTRPDAYRRLAQTHPHIDPADYQEHIEALTARGEVFNYRVEVAVSREHHRNWVDETYEATRRLSEGAKRDRHLRNRRQCAPLAGRPCVFRGLCDEDTPEARSAFRHVPPKGLSGTSARAF